MHDARKLVFQSLLNPCHALQHCPGPACSICGFIMVRMNCTQLQHACGWSGLINLKPQSTSSHPQPKRSAAESQSNSWCGSGSVGWGIEFVVSNCSTSILGSNTVGGRLGTQGCSNAGCILGEAEDGRCWCPFLHTGLGTDANCKKGGRVEAEVSLCSTSLPTVASEKAPATNKDLYHHWRNQTQSHTYAGTTCASYVCFCIYV